MTVPNDPKVALSPLEAQLEPGNSCDNIIHDAAGQEQRRLQEFFKYFIWQSTGYDSNDIDAEGYEPENAVISSDPVLNALAQLATHRLNADRAFISIIDDEHQFVIAEATKELSLFDATHHTEGQGLSIGARPLDLYAGVCSGTMLAFLDTTYEGPYIDTPNVYADRTRYIINDFSLEDMYKDRPYVVGWPHMRYYAEVPIKSGQHVLGSLAVIDNKPRQGLGDEHHYALVEISRSIMVHLNAVKTEQDHKQASKLLWGLNSFLHAGVETSDLLPDMMSSNFNLQLPKYTRPAGREFADRKMSTSPESVKPRPSQFNSQTMPDQAAFEAPSQPSERLAASQSRPGNWDSTNTLQQPDKASSRGLPSTMNPQQTTTLPPSSHRPSASTATETEWKQGELLKCSTVSDEIRTSFSNAAHILREAMDLDGVMFLDAGLTDFASRSDMIFDGMSAATSPHSQRCLATGYSPTSPMSLATPDAHSRSPLRDTINHQSHYFANVVEPNAQMASDAWMKSRHYRASNSHARNSGRLGFSVREHSISETQSEETQSHPSIAELLHQSLLYHYPAGKVFDFNQTMDEQDPIPSEAPTTASMRGSRRLVMARQDLDHALPEALPNVRSAVFVPLWHKGSWFAGGLGWTTKDKRVLEKDDLAYFSVFGTCIMAELTRLDLVASDKAKSNFISSISHELRSPLHGILGTAELLKDGNLDSVQHQLVKMIEACGTTLLETVSHILEYAKINRQTTTIDGKGPNRIITSHPLDLDVLLEDTVSAMMAGHRFSVKSAKEISDNSQVGSNSGARSLEPEILVVVNIEKKPSWNVRTISAAWRRIIMNLVGNSLKYTERGLLEVALRTHSEEQQSTGGLLKRVAALTIRDTGRGMSKDFLQNHLFTPFVQENELSVGTGLGLSIVQKIVQDLHGTIDIRSELGIGTEVQVLIPLEVLPDTQIATSPIEHRKGSFLLVGFSIYPSVDVVATGILSADSKTAIALQNALTNYACNWLGLETRSSGTFHPADVIAVGLANIDCLIATDVSASSGANAGILPFITLPSGSSLIVICKAEEDFSTVFESGRIQCLILPAGPRKMRQLINAALSADRSTTLRFPREIFNKDPIVSRSKDGQWVWKGTDMSISEPQPLGLNSQMPSVPPMRISPLPKSDTPERQNPKESQCNVLIVDDNTINVKVLSTFAKKLNCDYSTAANGQEAVDLYINSYSRNHYDFVLMDVNMPVMSGFEATRAIRDFEAAHGLDHVPVIALTGLGSADAEQEAFTSGMDIFWTKPVSLVKIRALVEGGIEALKAVQSG